MRKIMEMLFKCPVFKEGLNLTVRRGLKWALYFEENPVIPLKIYDTKDNPLGWIKIEKVIIMPFDSIQNSDLKDEHDKQCKTKEGLLKILKKVYEDFNEREIVTLVYFKKHEK